MFNHLKSLFRNKKEDIPTEKLPIDLFLDLPSHLIPGIDDGVKTIEESMSILRQFEAIGYKKIITTPHIMQGVYENNPQIILQGKELVLKAIKAENLNLQFHAAAEYFLDARFLDLLEDGNLLTLDSNNHILVELSYMFKQNNYEHILLNISQTKYKPILAHPERYLYLFDKDLRTFRKIKELGVLFQLNMFSLLGTYGEKTRQIAENLIHAGLYDFVGTDIHKPKHFEYVKTALDNKLLQKLLQSGKIRNHQFLEI